MYAIEEYFEKLQMHDWFYEYSDDYGVWRKGRESRAELTILSKENDTFATMYHEYVLWINAIIAHGPKQEEVQKPVLEDYL